MAVSFMLNTRSELLKSKKTAAFWLTIIGGLLIPFINTIAYIARPDAFGPMIIKGGWAMHISNSWQPAAAFLLPLYVILVTSLIVQIEYRNNTWKQVYASPRTYADVYFSKFLVVHFMILACFVLFNMGMILCGFIADLVHPDAYTFSNTAIPFLDMLKLSSKMYVSILAITAIQYWISLRIKNYIAPLGIGLALFIGGLMALQWDKIIYYPYAYTALTFFNSLGRPNNDITTASHEYYSQIWFVVVLLLGFWDTVRRRERG